MNKTTKTYSFDKKDATYDTAKQYDTNGFFEVKDNPISKSGVFEYAGRNIPDAENPDTMYKVYRPESELNNPETINSFKLLPFIDDHEMLGDEATPAENKGVHGVTGQDVYFKDNILYANLKVYSEALKNLIQGGKRELSCGFRNKWVKESGVAPSGESYDYIQTDIRGNHIALVDAGRMGSDVAVLDEKDKLNERQTMDEELKKLLEDIQARLASLEEMEKKEAEQESAEGEVEASEDEEKSMDEEKIDDKSSEDEEMKKDDMKSMDKKDGKSFDAEDFKKQIRKEFAQTQKLHDDLKSHIGTFDHSEMDLNSVAVYGAKKLGLTCDAKDALATVKGYIAAASKVNSVVSSSVDAMDNADDSVNKYLKGN
jgi:hypothetical protein